MFKRTDLKEIYGVAALLIFSAAVVLLQQVAFEHSLVIDGRSQLKAMVRDDRPFKGKSISLMRETGQGLELSCDIKASEFAWPYCEIMIDISGSSRDGVPQGVDLSGYDQVGLWVRHKHAVQTGTRFQLHNFSPIYSKAGDRETYKYNVVEYYEKFSPYPTWINTSNLHVPTWWLTRHDLSLDQVGVDISNVLSIGFVTGSHIKLGHYSLTIERIEFKGRYFNTATVFMALIGLWGLAAILFLYRRVSDVRRDLTRAKKQKSIWENKATRDPLTGAVNRIGAHKAFSKQMYSLNSSDDFSAIFMDIDHFKRINDTYGHSIGDLVLQKFVGVVNDNTRDSDILARWGGEEFILICDNTSIAPAVRLAEKLRAAIQSTQWPKDMELTCSFGVAQLGDESIEDFIERMDKALYSAKFSGRNCVVTAAQ